MSSNISFLPSLKAEGGGGGVSQFPHVSLSVLFGWIWDVGRGEEISSPTRSTSWVEIEALKKKEI